MWPYHPDVLRLPMEERVKRWPPLPLIENTRVVDAEVTAEDQRQLTRQYTEHAVNFIRANRERPFFLYLAHSMVHVPLHVSAPFDGASGQGLFGDVMAEVDWSVGQVLDALKELELDEKTLVVFTSDNGPWLSYGTHAGSAAPLREGKGTSFEGGFRVPCLMRWPGRIPAGTTCDELAATIDLLPTIATLIGGALPAQPIDGKDIEPLMFGAGGAQSPHEYFLYYYEDDQLQAIRDRQWKLHFPHGYRTLAGRAGRDDGQPITYEQAEIGLALFDLKQDREEHMNLADEHPDVVARLQQAADQTRAALGDSLTKRVGAEVRPAGKLAAGDAQFNSLLQNQSLP
jgi:arylsulfatase A-like enzyme